MSANTPRGASHDGQAQPPALLTLGCGVELHLDFIGADSHPAHAHAAGSPLRNLLGTLQDDDEIDALFEKLLND